MTEIIEVPFEQNPTIKAKLEAYAKESNLKVEDYCGMILAAHVVSVEYSRETTSK